MDQKKFEAILPLIVPLVLAHLIHHFHWDEMNASTQFYQSELYAQLEREETKLWHLSALALMHLFCEEYETGIIHYPEEV